MDTFYEATKGNVASAGLDIRLSGDRCLTSDTQATIKRARTLPSVERESSLTDKGLLKCSDDVYRLGDKAT